MGRVQSLTGSGWVTLAVGRVWLGQEKWAHVQLWFCKPYNRQAYDVSRENVGHDGHHINVVIGPTDCTPVEKKATGNR